MNMFTGLQFEWRPWEKPLDKHSFSLNYSSTIVRKAWKSPLLTLVCVKINLFYLVCCSTHLYYCNVKGHIDSFKQAFKNSPTKCFNSRMYFNISVRRLIRLDHFVSTVGSTVKYPIIKENYLWFPLPRPSMISLVLIVNSSNTLCVHVGATYRHFFFLISGRISYLFEMMALKP